MSLDFDEEAFEFRIRAHGNSEKSPKRRSKIKLNDPRKGSWKGKFVRPSSSMSAQKVAVNTLIKSGKFQNASARKHVSYLLRDDAGVEKEASELFCSHNYPSSRSETFTDEVKTLTPDSVSGAEHFLERSRNDEHHFRFIVSPESPGMDLETYTYDLMKKVAFDVGSEIEWMAVQHHDTDTPHVHIILRGHDLRTNKPLYLHPHYLNTWMRNRAEQVATRALGPRTQKQIDAFERREVEAKRFTSLDKSLLKLRDDDGNIHIDASIDAAKRLMLRLKVLRNCRLAIHTKPNVWMVHRELEDKLRAFGRENDHVRSAIAARYASESDLPVGVFEDLPTNKTSIVSSVGPTNDFNDDRFIVCECSDGRSYRLTSEDVAIPLSLKSGSIVRFNVDIKSKKSRLVVLDPSSIERQAHKREVTWLDGLAEKDLKRTAGTFGKIVSEGWKERAAYLLELGISADSPKNRVAAVNELQTKSLVSEIENRTSKVFVERPKRFSGHLTSNHGDYSVVENETSFTLVETTSYLKRSLHRQVDVKNIDEKQNVYVKDATICPVTTKEVVADLKYCGPTWLDKQFSNPDFVISPDINDELSALKSIRLKFLKSENIVSSEDVGSDLLKLTRVWESENLVQDIQKKSSLAFQTFEGFQGTMSQPIKLRGGSYVVVSNNSAFTVVKMDRNLQKHVGTNVVLSQAVDKNLRSRVIATPVKEKLR